MDKQVLEYLQQADLPRELQLVAEIIGLEAVRKLLLHLPSSTFYVPAPTRLHKLVSRYVEANHVKTNSGGIANARELALKLGITQQSVKQRVRRLQ